MSQLESPPATVHRLRPIRVLLIGTDKRFLRVAGALLASEGHSVQVSDKPSELLELVYTQGSDVVVIDASASLTHAARAAASLEAMPVPVAAVLVADQERIPSVGALALVAKWGSFHELSERVERAYEWRRFACA
jgi:CheY-like chemotaxis protein